MNYDCRLDTGNRKRKQGGLNEDSIATATAGPLKDSDQQLGIFVLADGAGGHDNGDIASTVAVTSIRDELVTLFEPLTDNGWASIRDETAVSDVPSLPTRRSNAATDRALKLQYRIENMRTIRSETDGDVILMALESVIKTAHHQLLAYAAAERATPHTTVVAAVIVDDYIYYAWVGDSRLYLLSRTNERIDQLTRDHTVVEDRRQRGEIEPVEALVHREGNMITRALGGSQYERPETSRIDVETGSTPLYATDVVVITSDGLVDAFVDAAVYHDRYLRSHGDDRRRLASEIRQLSVTDDQIRDLVFDADSPAAATAALIDLANERGGKDNLSIIVVEPDLVRQPPGIAAGRRTDEPTDPAPVATDQLSNHHSETQTRLTASRDLARVTAYRFYQTLITVFERHKSLRRSKEPTDETARQTGSATEQDEHKPTQPEPDNAGEQFRIEIDDADSTKRP